MSGDVENIVVKPEPLLDADPQFWLDESSGDVERDADQTFDGPAFVTSSGEVVAIDAESGADVVQTPFYLESYFHDDVSRSASPDEQQAVAEVDRVTCFQCNIVFCDEHRMLEHLMTHIDVYRMGCGVCDKVSLLVDE